MLETVIDFIKEHTVEALALWGALLTIIGVVVKLTKNKVDDKVFSVFVKILDTFELNPNSNQDREKKKKKKELEEEMDERNDSITRDRLTDALK